MKKIVKGKIKQNKPVTKEVYNMDIEAPWIGAKAKCGQFVTIKLSNKAYDPLLRIPLGIFKIRKNGISLLYKVVGPGTTILKEKQPGEEVDILGPLGNGFNLKNLNKQQGKKLYLIAGGYGIAPLFSLAEELIARNMKIEFFIGTGTKNSLLCLKELKKKKIKVHITTDDGTCGIKGCAGDALVKEIKKGNNPGIIFACGPEPMIKNITEIAIDNNIPAQVTKDEYMACGIGACHGCAVETTEGIKLSCTDGPVFDASILKWGRE